MLFLVQIWGCSQPIMPWKEKVLWDPVNSISALCCLSHLAFAISCVLDCYLLAGSRTYFAHVSGITEPKYQALGNTVLLIALTVVVVGSMIGTWEAVTGVLDVKNSFLWGHQGYGTLN